MKHLDDANRLEELVLKLAARLSSYANYKLVNWFQCSTFSFIDLTHVLLLLVRFVCIMMRILRERVHNIFT